MDLLSSGFSTVIDSTAGTLVSLVKEEFFFIYDVEKYAEQLRQDLETFQEVLKQADKLRLEESNLRPWLMMIKNAVYDAEDVLETFSTHVCLWKRTHMGKNRILKNPSAGLREILKKSEISKMAKEVSETLVKLGRQKGLFSFGVPISAGGGGHSDQLYEAPITSSIEIGDVIGRDDEKDNLVKLLLSDEQSSQEEGRVSVIPIVGMGGLGKTSLARYVFNDERVKKCFKPTMWACITADYSLPRVLRDLIESDLKMEYTDGLAEDFLGSRLLEILTGNKFLLVLDDVWIQDYLEWERLEKLLRKGDKGSRVLVTSRSHEVCRVMATQRPFRLGYLKEDQCWSLFKKIAFVNSNNINPPYRRRELEDIGRQIVRKCQGLPLAVKSMAGLLRNNTDAAKWNDILNSSVWELDNQDQNPGQTPNILPALKLSYNYLPSHLKQCFYYCSIFPKAHVFVKEDLIKLWVAQGYVPASSRQKRAEEVGSEYFQGLISRFFFETAKSENQERYKMHDLIHDLARAISSPHCSQLKDIRSADRLHDTGCTSETRHVSVLDRNVEQPALLVTEACQKVRTFLFPVDHMKNFGEALTKILTSLKQLRALDLSSSVLQELPNAIEELKLLRYLDLSRTEIKVLPESICNLYNLQVLKLLGCVSLFRLPANFSDLVNLCHLELDGIFWFKCLVLPPKIGNLSRLRNWHAFHVGCEEGYRISELGNMDLLTGKLHISQLENAVKAADAKLGMKRYVGKLVLEWSIDRDVNPKAEAAEERVLEDLQPNQNISELQINNCRGTRIPTWITGDHSLQNLATLSLNQCFRFRILALGHLPHLRELFTKGLQELEELSENGKFFSLRRLEISHCPRLHKLPEVLLNLRVLKIKKCDSLRALPITPSLCLSNLIDNPFLEDWKEATCQILSQNSHGQSVNHTGSSFSQLRDLKVVNCPRLCDLPKYFAPQKLEIHQCQGIQSLPKPEFAWRFQQLVLGGSEDTSLLRAIPRTSSLYSLVISNISNLTNLPRWPELSGLKALYISNCQDLLALPERETEGSLQSLTSLTFLSICGCPNLTSLPQDGLPTNLECLVISSCSSLKLFGGPQTLRGLTSLKDLCIENCPLIESLPENGFHENLKHLCIKGCSPSLLKHCQDRNIIKNLDLENEHIELPSASPATQEELPIIQMCLPLHQVFLRCLGC